MCVSLGAATGSEELRMWADRELRGWGADDELPEYRKVASSLFMDGQSGFTPVRGQTLSAEMLEPGQWSLLADDLSLRDSVSTITDMVISRRASGDDYVSFTPPGDGMLLTLINHKLNSSGDRTQLVSRIYWAVPLAVLGGVIEAVRAHLLTLVAVVDGATKSKDPSAVSTSADNYVRDVAIHGDNNSVTINQVASSGKWSLTWLGDRPKGFWARLGVAIGVLSGAVGLARAVLGG